MAAADAEPLSPARDRVPAADHALAAAARELLGQGQGLEAAAMLGAALEGAADLARTWLLNDIALCAMQLGSATMLTLLVVPVVYLAIDDGTDWLKRHSSRLLGRRDSEDLATSEH